MNILTEVALLTALMTEVAVCSQRVKLLLSKREEEGHHDIK